MKRLLLIAVLVASRLPNVGAAEALAPYVVTAARMPQPAGQSAVTVDVFDGARLRQAPALALDDVLRDSAAFSLFRRSGSLAANPTAQGVSLRGLGPSGASRTLVLLDGVPLNDPFGGWVPWGSVPRAALSRAELVRGGGSGVWGHAALGGTLQLHSRAVDPLASSDASLSGSLEGFAGERGLLGTGLTAATVHGATSARLSASWLETAGFHPLAPTQRGPVDRPLTLRQHAWLGQVTHQLSRATRFEAAVRAFDEDRGNGTALQHNTSEFGQISLGLTGQTDPGRTWQTRAYAQRQRFSSFFSAVNASRTSETPANHQFDVPATAAGGSVQFTWEEAAHATTAGADLRGVEGETREDFLFTTGRFTRRRHAGGRQFFAGAFVRHERQLGATRRASLALRTDRWVDSDGHRDETDLANGAIVRRERPADRHGGEVSPQFGFVWTPAPGWRTRASAYQAFRVPTLNESHRPFRVGIINTEANAALRRETLAGAEAGLDHTGTAGRIALTVFHQDLRDAVANVTLSRTPTAISRQRQNLDRVRVRGVELTAEWQAHPRLRLRADWLGSDALVRRATAQPALTGLRLAQVPRHTVTAGAEWSGPTGWRIDLRWRHSTLQYEDDENLLPLAPATTIDASVAKSIGAHLTWFAAGENLLDARIETGRSNEGLVSFGSPRQLRSGLRLEW